MHLLDLTLATAAENLALDEALLDEAELAGRPCQWLRLWEPAEPLVVLGNSGCARAEVRLKTCQALGVPVLRRASGGGAILAAPGCLMYAVVLSYRLQPELRLVDCAHGYVLGRMAAALAAKLDGVARAGTSDLAWQGRKFSGNSLRCRREHLLYHGTLMYDLSIELVSRCLEAPPRQPDYRANRGHREFLINLPLGRDALRAAVADAWPCQPWDGDWPRARVERLVAEKYGRAQWNLRR